MINWIRRVKAEQIRRELEIRRGIDRPKMIDLAPSERVAGFMLYRYSNHQLGAELRRRHSNPAMPWLLRQHHYPVGTLYEHGRG